MGNSTPQPAFRGVQPAQLDCKLAYINALRPNPIPFSAPSLVSLPIVTMRNVHLQNRLTEDAL